MSIFYDCLKKLGDKLDLEQKKDIQAEARKLKKTGLPVKQALERVTADKIAELEKERSEIIDTIEKSDVFKTIESRGQFAKTKPGIAPARARAKETEAPEKEGGKINWSGQEIRPLDVPELVRITKELLGGKYPQVWRALRAGVLGDFTYRPGKKGFERIRIAAGLGADAEQLSKTVAHELGHLVDYLPYHTIKHGNILGRLAGLKKFMKHTLPIEPMDFKLWRGKLPLGPLTKADRARIRKEARQILMKENADQLIDEVIRKEIPITPDDVLNIWNMVSGDIPKDLMDYISGLDTAGKKAVVKAALKGQVAEELKKFAKVVKEKTGKKIKYKASEKEIADKYKELIEAELRKRKLVTMQEIRSELEQFTIRWKPFNPSENWKFTQYRFSGPELYADFFSSVMTDPAFAFKYAPQSWDMWHNYIDNKPQVKDLYDKIQAELRAGDKHRSIRKSVREGMLKKEKEWSSDVKRDAAKLMRRDELGYLLIDTAFAVNRRVKRLGESNVPDHLNPRYKLSDLQYWQNYAEGYLTEMEAHVLRPTKKAGIDIMDLHEYLLYRRIENQTAKKIWPEGITPELAKELVKEMDEQHPRLRQAADRFYAIRKEWLTDNPKFIEMHSPALIKYIEDNPNYATLDIVQEATKEYGQDTAAQLFNEASIPGKIHRQIGTFKSTGPMLTATILNDMRLMRAMIRNDAAKSVVKLFKDHPKDFKGEFFRAKRKWNGKFMQIKKVHSKDKDLATLIWMENGKAQGLIVPRFVAYSLQKNPIDTWYFVRLARFTAQPFKAIFTQYNPGFMGFNLWRDFNKTLLLTPRMNVPRALWWYTKAIRPALRSVYAIPDPVIKEMQKQSMLISVANYRGDRPDDMMYDRLLARYHFKPKMWENQITKPFQMFFHNVDNVGRIIERIPKVAAYRMMKKKFPDLPDEFLRHFIRTGPGSPAFMHRGALSGIYNSVLLYSNANKEGPRSVLQSMYTGGPETQKILSTKRRKYEIGYKVTKYHLIPKIFMISASIGLFDTESTDEDDKWSRVMAGVSEYDMTTYHIIPLGLTESGRSVYIRIPQDEFGRLIGGIMYKTIMGMLGVKDVQEEIKKVFPQAQFYENKKKLPLELMDWMSGQVPSLSPLPSMIFGDAVAMISGHVPYDMFRMRPAYNPLIGEAGGVRELEALGKYMANKMGGGIVHRFKGENKHAVEKEVKELTGISEEILNMPVLSNIIGRWLKVSDYGLREKIIAGPVSEVRKRRANVSLLARDYMIYQLQGRPEKITEEMTNAMLEKGATMQFDTMYKLFAQRYGNTIATQLINAQSQEELIAIQQMIDDKNWKNKIMEIREND